MEKRKRKPLHEQVEDEPDKPLKGKLKPKLFSTGSTLLNLACSDTIGGGIAFGTITTIPGQSVGGKTLLAVTALAEVAQNSKYDEYDLELDDVESAFAFDVERMWGRKFNERIIMIEPTTKTIQDLKSSLILKCREGRPFIRVVDSLDALSSDEELEKDYRNALKRVKSDDAVKELKGSYKTEKAKILGETLREINKELERTGSSLILIQQERQKIGGMIPGQKTTSGGEAPYFYSFHQIWVSRVTPIKSKGRKIGGLVRARVTKNKYTGKERDVFYDVYYDYGIDDLGSCINFLVGEKHWKKTSNGVITAPELDLKGTTKKLIMDIEKKGLERKLKKLTGRVWKEIEDSILLNRKPKYD